jgi:Flp pilus assembly protein protease CpaA
MLMALVTTFLSPAYRSAATIQMPWDYVLLAFQDMLIHTIAPWIIGFAFASSVFLYVIGGHDEQAGCLFGSVVGSLIALSLVYILKYVAF